MNIQELLETLKAYECDGECTCEGECTCGKKDKDESLNEEKDLAAEPAKMEKDDTKEIKIVEPEIDTKELLKKLESFDFEVLDAIKEQDPEMQFEMIDGKQPLKECDKQLISDEEKEERTEELKKTRGKRLPKQESAPEPPEEPTEKIKESVEVKDEVVAKYETVDGKHEIIRTAEGLYKNRYFLKEDGNARRTTRGVKTLPTAVGALMKRFPEAVEIKE